MNLGSKTGGFGEPYDELLPYLVGSPVRNGVANKPVSTLAVWPPPYTCAGPFVHAISAHIHCVAVNTRGEAWAWGCGSNDGRCGVERFLNMNGDGKPPALDTMKCYLMGPHPVGIARPRYWKFGSSLQGMQVLKLASSRNHMACIAVKC
jgi:hypothetical protein